MYGISPKNGEIPKEFNNMVTGTEEKGEETLVETPTQVSELATLQAELEALKTQNQRLPELEKGFKSLQQTLTEKDKELKRRADLDSRIDGIQETIEVLATAMASRGDVEELDPEKRQDVLAELKKRRADQEAKAKQREITETQQEYAQKADSLFARAKIAFADDDEGIERVEDLLMSGRFERAEARVVKAEGKKVLAKDGKVETEEQRIDRLAEEKHRAYLEGKGLLDNYSSTPSSSVGEIPTSLEQYKKWVETIPQSDYERLKPKIDKMKAEGKIK